MFIRRTQTRSTVGGEIYFTHRLVRSERIAGKVRQHTLLNLGRHFDVEQCDWPALTRRIDELLAGQLALPCDGSLVTAARMLRDGCDEAARWPGKRPNGGPGHGAAMRAVRPCGAAGPGPTGGDGS